MNTTTIKNTDTIFINSNNTPDSLLEHRMPYPEDDATDKPDKKAKPSVIYGLTGIVNQQNTCYMNSAIQALSHNYPLTNYLFTKKQDIYQILKNNARKILKNETSFKIESVSIVPIELRNKIQDPEYSPEKLTADEFDIVLNHTITGQLIRLLERMWEKNCVVVPTSFRKVFSQARDKFFYGCEQHDAEEAYSCILQKMQEELAEEKNIRFLSDKPSVQEFLQFKNNITEKIKKATKIEEKKELLDLYKQKKKTMAAESLTIEAFREMKKYYGTAYSRITEIFSGFLHSSINCSDALCGYSSNKFDPFLHLSLPMPQSVMGRPITIEECMQEYCKEEILDDKNLWLCEGCGKKVQGIKKLKIWTPPPVLVIQIKRFNVGRFSKDGRLVKYPTEHFDISPMISTVQLSPNKCNKYKLQCIINHTGGLSGGHYYTYCLDEDSGIWSEINDESVRPMHPDRIITNNAYLLFYIREDMIKTN